VRSLIMKVRIEENTKSDSDLSFIAALSVLTGNDFLQQAYPTYEECYTAQELRGMVRDYYNGPTREDRGKYEEALARADISQRTVDELKKQLEKYQEVFISNNDTAIKREESIRADYRTMMEKERESYERETSLIMEQKDQKIKDLEEENSNLRQDVEKAKENTADPASMVAILKERDDYANEVERLTKMASKTADEKNAEIKELRKELESYREEAREKAIRSKVKAEIEKEYEAEAAKIAARIEEKDEELTRAREMISRMQEEKKNASPEGRGTSSAEGPTLTEAQLKKIADYVMTQISGNKPVEEEEGISDEEEEILQELMEAQEEYESARTYPEEEEEEANTQAAEYIPEEVDEPIGDDILPQHHPSPLKEMFEEHRSEERPPLFFRRRWREMKETEEIEEIGFRVIASDEFSDVQKNLIQEAIDNNLSLKNLRRLADPSIPEKNMSQALHYFLRQEQKAS